MGAKEAISGVEGGVRSECVVYRNREGIGEAYMLDRVGEDRVGGHHGGEGITTWDSGCGGTVGPSWKCVAVNGSGCFPIAFRYQGPAGIHPQSNHQIFTMLHHNTSQKPLLKRSIQVAAFRLPFGLGGGSARKEDQRKALKQEVNPNI